MENQITMDEFITRAALVMKVEIAPENPNLVESNTWEADHWFFTLNTSRRQMSGYYSTGYGHRTYSVAAARRFMLPNVHRFKQGDKMPSRFVVADSHYKVAFVPTPPTLASVLDCLAVDASTIESARSFNEWADDMGYDSNSRADHKSYKITKRQIEKLRALLGTKLYNVLLNNVERL